MNRVKLWLYKPIHVLGINSGQEIELDYYWEDEDSMKELYNDIFHSRIRIIVNDEAITLDPFEILIEDLIGDIINESIETEEYIDSYTKIEDI